MNCGLVGAGYFAAHHAEAWQRLDGVQLRAVTDLNTERGSQFAERYGIPRSYAAVEEMLDNEPLDFVDIATRPQSHLSLTNLAIERKLDVICQKPMAPTWEECRQMVDQCRAAGVRLLIHENWRWQPWYRQVWQLMDEGRVGRPIQISFVWRSGDGRGPQPYATQPYFCQMPRLLVYETLVHLLDTFRFFLGEIDSVYCQLKQLNPAIVGEDQALIQVQFANGALGLIDANRVVGPQQPTAVMGTFSLEGHDGVVRIAPDGRIDVGQATGPAEPLNWSPPKTGYRGDSVLATQRHLVTCLQTGESAESEAADYLRTVAAVEACYESDRTAKPISLREFLGWPERQSR